MGDFLTFLFTVISGSVLAILAVLFFNISLYTGTRRVYCPHRHVYGQVKLNFALRHLAHSMLRFQRSPFRVVKCSLRGSVDHCDELCLRMERW